MSTTAAGLSKEQLKRYHPFISEKRPGKSSEAIKAATMIARDLEERFGAQKELISN